MTTYTRTNALISECGLYRYRLSRSWGDGGKVCWVMLNPSTADANEDDATIRKCVGFSARMGFGEMDVVNLFACRATNPEDIKKFDDPVGPDNDHQILSAALGAARTIVAWGTYGSYLERGREVIRMLYGGGILCKAFDVTKFNQPKHPLYIPYNTKLFTFRL